MLNRNASVSLYWRVSESPIRLKIMTDQLRQSIVSVLGIALCCCSLACRQSATDAAGGTAQPQSAGDAAAGTAQPPKEGMQKALTSFHAVITSPKTDLQLRPGQDTKVPVKVQN